MAFALCTSAPLAGCVTHYTPLRTAQDSALAQPGGEQRFELRKGDRLRVLTKDGQRREIELVSADPTHLHAKTERIAYADIVFMERVEVKFDAPLAFAAGAVLVTVTVLPGVAAAAILSSAP
jgi:hypothetical protein